MRTKKQKPSIREYFGRLRIWLAPAVSVAVILVLGLTIVSSRLKSIRQGWTDRNGQREKLNQVIAKLDKIENLEQELYKERLVLLTEALPNNPDLPQFLFVLEKLARQVGVEVDGVSFQDAKDSQPRGTSQGVKEISASVTVNGRQEDFSNFIKQLEIYRRLIAIDKVQMNRNVSVASPAASINGVVQLRTFFAPLPSSLGAPEEPIETFTADDEALITELRNRLGGIVTKGPSSPHPVATDSAGTNPFE